MTYSVEIATHVPSYENVMEKQTYEAMEQQITRRYQTIFDLEYEKECGDGQVQFKATELLLNLNKDIKKWLKGKTCRIEANFRVKEAPDSLATSLIGGECVTYGYVLSVVFDDPNDAVLFKLTFGGA